jgi:hypothetical protein
MVQRFWGLVKASEVMQWERNDEFSIYVDLAVDLPQASSFNNLGK